MSFFLLIISYDVRVCVFKTNDNYGGQFVLARVFLAWNLPGSSWWGLCRSTEEDWLSLSQQQSVPAAPWLGGRLCVPVPPSVLGLCLAWTYTGLVHAFTCPAVSRKYHFLAFIVSLPLILYISLSLEGRMWYGYPHRADWAFRCVVFSVHGQLVGLCCSLSTARSTICH